jgi:hypothetical protein
VGRVRREDVARPCRHASRWYQPGPDGTS